jgi:hypothetical protein
VRTDSRRMYMRRKMMIAGALFLALGACGDSDPGGGPVCYTIP